MGLIELNEDTFRGAITDHGILLVDWWAAWCGPCRMFAPVFEAAAARHPDIGFAKVDTEANQELAQAAGIRSIPTLMVFRDEVLLFSQAGVLPPRMLDDLIVQVRDLDMAEVHQAIADRAAT